MLLSLTAAYSLYAPLTLIEENAPSDFGDLGMLLFAGVLVAIALAIGFTFVRMRLRDKRPAPDFISINPFPKKKD